MKQKQVTPNEDSRASFSSTQNEEQKREEAFALASSCFNLADAIVHSQFGYCNEETQKDLIQEGHIALFEAALTYDERFKTRFSTYGYPFVRNACHNYLKKLNASISPTNEDYDDAVIAAEPEEDKEEKARFTEVLNQSFSKLTPRQKEAICYRYGLGGYPMLKTFVQIGKAMGISDEAARSHVSEGIVRLRNEFHD